MNTVTVMAASVAIVEATLITRRRRCFGDHRSVATTPPLALLGGGADLRWRAGVANLHTIEEAPPHRSLRRRWLELVGLLHQVKAVLALHRLEPCELRL